MGFDELIGLQVRHNEFGIGIIKKISGDCVYVNFGDERDRIFEFPKSFGIYLFSENETFKTISNFSNGQDSSSVSTKDDIATFNNEVGKLKRNGYSYCENFIVATFNLSDGAFRNDSISVICNIISALTDKDEILNYINRVSTLIEHSFLSVDLGLYLLCKIIFECHLSIEMFDAKTKTFISEFLNDYKHLENELVSRGFEGFLREERFDNLLLILNDGKIFARNSGKSFNSIADEEVISITDTPVKDYVRFYYYKKTPTNYRFDKKIDNLNKLAYLVFDWNLLYSNIFSYFYDGNAASKYSKYEIAHKYLCLRERKLNIDWDTIFSRGPVDLIVTPIGDVKADINVIRKRNAEFLVFGNVELKKYLKKIVFKDQTQLDNFFVNDFNDKKYYKSISIIDRSYFND